MGDVQARSWMVAGKSDGGSTPRLTATIVDPTTGDVLAADGNEVRSFDVSGAPQAIISM